MKENDNNKEDFQESDIREPLYTRDKNNAEEEEENREDSPKKSKSKHLKGLVLLLVASILIATGVYFLLRRPVTETLRIIEKEKIVEKIEAGAETIIVKKDAFVIEGEGYEIFEDTTYFQTPEDVIAALPDEVVLTAAGTIQMDAIDLSLPLWDEAGVVSLRYGAGILEDSVLPGQEGNLVVLGHRMKTYGSIFNRLGEIKIGDEVIIETTDGTTYVYIVDQIESSIKPSALPDYIEQNDSDGVRLTLVTCTPTGVGSHRLIVIAHLAE